MKNKIIKQKPYFFILLILIITLIFSQLSSAYVIRNVTAERKAEWERYLQYKEDYIKMNDLKGYEQYIYEPNLIQSFGFRPASYYYVPPYILEAKYNPPLQGEAYYTPTRGYTSSLNQPSAVQYYADYENGKYSGYVAPELNGIYFDHPQARQTYGLVTFDYNNYNNPAYYSNHYPASYYYNTNYLYNSNYFYYYSNSYSGYYHAYPTYNYNYYNYAYEYAYPDIDYAFYSAYANYAYADRPASYARIADPVSGGYYVLGFY